MYVWSLQHCLCRDLVSFPSKKPVHCVAQEACGMRKSCCKLEVVSGLCHQTCSDSEFSRFCHYPRHQTCHQPCHQPCLKCFLFRFHHRHLRTKHSLLICWLTAGRLANGQPCGAEAYRFYRFPKALVMKWMRLRWKVSFCLFQKYAHFIAIFWNYWTPVSKSLFEKCFIIIYVPNVEITMHKYIIYIHNICIYMLHIYMHRSFWRFGLARGCKEHPPEQSMWPWPFGSSIGNLWPKARLERNISF